MLRKHIYPAAIIVLLSLGLIPVFGQGIPVSLEEAIRIARDNHAGLRSLRLTVDQNIRLAEAGPKQPLAEFSLSGDEFDFGGRAGVHGLSARQSFLLPGTIRAHRQFDESQVALANEQLELGEHTLRMHIGKAYYRVLYTRQMSILSHEDLALYEDFLQMTSLQLSSGETGKIPQLAARSRLGSAQLALEHAEEQYEVARILFNQWLRSDTLYTAEGQMTASPGILLDTADTDNPHLGVQQAMVARAEADVVRERAQGAPRISSGLALQTANSVFPLFGYQIGVQVPIFKKSYRRHIEAAELKVDAQSAALEAKANEITRNRSELRYRLQHLLHIITYLQEDLRPILDEQQLVNRAAYLEGEIGYLEYLDALRQEVQLRRQLLDAQYEFNVLRLELEYWSGQ